MQQMLWISMENNCAFLGVHREWQERSVDHEGKAMRHENA